MKVSVDVVLGLSYGDEAKAKVTAELAKKNKYTHTLRFNGGNNCGHTIYLGDEKVVTHAIPTASILGIKGVVGSGCVVHTKSFLEELEYLSKYRSDISSLVKIANNVHIIEDRHLEEENNESKIGTTKKGIGPAYRDKYARIGIRAESIPELKDFIIDPYEELIKDGSAILAEGAQGFLLDISSDSYPYVTSSTCGIGAVISNGIPISSINKVYGIIKGYTTYVGNKVFQDMSDTNLSKMQDIGKEIGATTGRKRQCNYLDLTATIKAIKLNSVTHLVINKIDVLEQINVWKIYQDNKLIDLKSKESFISHIQDEIESGGINKDNFTIIWSDSPFTCNV